MSHISKTTLVARRLSVHFQNIISPTKSPQKYLDDINHHIAVFREMLLILGQEKDCPELRAKIRKWRCTLVEECQITTQLLISLKNNCSSDKFGNTDHFLIMLFHLMHLFLRELDKSHRLTQIIPMDMEEYFENRACTSNLGNVISEILLLKKQRKPDFISEELSSIALGAEQVSLLLLELKAFVPREFDSNIEHHNSRPKKVKSKLLCCCALSC